MATRENSNLCSCFWRVYSNSDSQLECPSQRCGNLDSDPQGIWSTLMIKMESSCEGTLPLEIKQEPEESCFMKSVQVEHTKTKGGGDQTQQPQQSPLDQQSIKHAESSEGSISRR